MSNQILYSAWQKTPCRYAEQAMMIGGDWAGTGEDRMRDWARAIAASRLGAVVVNGADRPLFGEPADGPHPTLWHPAAVARLAPLYDRMWSILLPRLIWLDGESRPSIWSEGMDLSRIAADPRYPAAAKAYGLQTVNGWDLDASIDRMANDERRASILRWPLANKIPFAWWADCPKRRDDAAYVPEYNGHPHWYAPSGYPLYMPPLYGWYGQLRRRPSDGALTCLDGEPLTPWQLLVWQLGQLMAADRAQPDCRLMPCIGPRSGGMMSRTGYVSLLVHALLYSGGLLATWAGDLPPDAAAEDADSMTRAGDRFVAALAGRRIVRRARPLVGRLPSDKTAYVCTGAEVVDAAGKVSSLVYCTMADQVQHPWPGASVVLTDEYGTFFETAGAGK